MKKNTRSQNSINNAAISLISTLITTLLNFINRTVFIQVLSVEYLGLGGLFSNILKFLALAELGVGNAINFALYKPLKDDDKEKVKSLMALYKRFYTLIGLAVLICGASLTPFLGYLIKELPKDIPNIEVYYLMYVVNSAASYFFTYKRSLILCDQRQYISTLESLCVSVASCILRLVILVKTHNYLAYLMTSVAFTIIGNIIISYIAGRLYPYINDKEYKVLEKDESLAIRKNIGAMIFHKIGWVVVFATDNLIISKFIGLVGVGLYSNYTMIINGIKSLISKLFVASSASVGNLIASGDRDHCKNVMEHILFINTWLYGFSSICLFCLIQPFISIWLNDEFLLPQITLLAAVFSFYLTGMRQTVLVFKDAAGIFRPDRYKPLIESVVNITVSIPLAIRFSITGVILGTILSTVLVSFWFEAYVFYKHYFGTSFGSYMAKQASYGLINILLCVLTYSLCSFVRGGVLLSFIVKFMICMFFPNAIYYTLFRNSSHFKYFVDIASRIINQKFK